VFAQVHAIGSCVTEYLLEQTLALNQLRQSQVETLEVQNIEGIVLEPVGPTPRDISLQQMQI
jgi:hypothetical protein